MAVARRPRQVHAGSVTDLSHLARPGAEFVLRVTPRARRTAVEDGGDGVLRVRVTAPPENGRANAAVIAALAEALGVAKSRLTLLRGTTGRDKRIRLD